MAVEIVVPVLGESVTEATIARWIKQSGDAVKADEPIVELETDKVTVEVPAPASGVLGDLKVAEGDNVEVGALLASIDESGTPAPAKAAPKAEAAKAEPAKAPAPAAAAPKPAPAAPAVVPQPAVSMSPAALAAGAPPMPPSVKKLVAENGLDPNAIPASGRGGRLTKADVLDFLASGGKDVFALAEPEADRSEERVKMSRLRRRIAERLKEAQNTAAMLTTFNEVDMTAILAARKEYKDDSRSATMCASASCLLREGRYQGLRDVPAVNARLMAMRSSTRTTMMSALLSARTTASLCRSSAMRKRLAFAGIEKAIGGFAKKARDGKLSMADMSGGTFTISNGGVYGSLMSTPISEPPQSGILGMHKTQMRPMVMPEVR